MIFVFGCKIKVYGEFPKNETFVIMANHVSFLDVFAIPSAFDTARKFDMEVQPQLVLLQKTLLNIEGLGRELYPDLDLWATAKPVLQEWMRQRTDIRVHVKRLIKKWPQISEDLARLPVALHQIVQRVLEDVNEDVTKKNFSQKELNKTSFFERNGIIAGVLLTSVGLLCIGIGLTPIWPAWFLAGLGLVWTVIANYYKQ